MRHLLIAVLLAATASAAPAQTAEDAAAALNELIKTAGRVDDPVPLAEEVLRRLEADPSLIPQIEAVGPMLMGLDRVGAHALETRLLASLIDADWLEPGSIGPPAEWMDVELALRRMELGDVEGAEDALADIRMAVSIMSVMVDRRFEPLWPKLEAAGWLDVRPAIEAEVEEAAALRAAYPRRLEAVLLHLSALRRAGRPAEAVAAGAAVQATLEAGRTDDYDDADAYANWVLQDIARSLSRMGETAEAWRLQSLAAAYKEKRTQGDENNVSQVLNAAGALARSGEPEAALASIESFTRDDVSRYGWTVVLLVRACSYAALEDDDALEATLAELDAWRADARDNLSEAYLCAGRTKDAVEALIWRLDSGHDRTDVLLTLQTFGNSVYVPTGLTSRRDVRTAIKRAGRVLRWDLASLN